MTIETEEVCLNWEPRFVPLLLTRYTQPGDPLHAAGSQGADREWRHQYNRKRPHSSLGNRPPAPEVYPAPFLGSPLPAAAGFGLT
jgi:hypothetical protein